MQNITTESQKSTFAIFGLLAIAILIILTILGGIPSAERLPIFALGTTLSIGITALIGAIGWHLLFRPLPEGHRVTRQLLVAGKARYFLGIVMVMGLANVAVGSMWDEIWHAKYGIPFGEDFLWRPHQMLYFGFIVTAVVAAWGLWLVMTSAKGTLQQRFRTDPAIGFAIIAGAYTAFALPADPIWHNFYGEDIAAWSLPHMILLVMVLVTGISSATMQIADNQERDWQLLTKPTWHIIFMILIFAATMAEYVMVMVVEWYFRTPGVDPAPQLAMIASRPDWLLPAIITFIGLFFGGSVLFTTKRIGAPTLAAIIAVAVRYGIEVAIQSPYTGTIPYAIVIPMMLALDITYFVYLRRQIKPSLLISTVVSIVVLAVIGLPVINMYFTAPVVTFSNAPIILAVAFVVAYAGLWMAEVVAGFLHQVAAIQATVEKTQVIALREQNWINGAVYAGFGLFALFLMMTAVPPV